MTSWGPWIRDWVWWDQRQAEQGPGVAGGEGETSEGGGGWYCCSYS